MRKIALVLLLMVCACGCKQRRTDTPTAKEKIVVSSFQAGVKSKIVSERFGELHVSTPEKDAKSALVLFSNGPWSQELTSIAEQLSKESVFVIGVDSEIYLRSIKSEDEDCIYLAGEIERLVQSVEKGIGIRSFMPAALTGQGIGAELAENVFYQSPDRFFGLIVPASNAEPSEALKFCDPDDSKENTEAAYRDEIKVSPKATINVSDLKTFLDEIPASSGHTISSDLPQGVADLPLEIVMPRDESRVLGGDTFVIFLSGDGGWASIDEELSQKLIERNIPVIGVSSLQYFWKKQTPETGAKDLDRIIHVYSGLLKKPKVALFGFSFGADVLPAYINSLSPQTRAMVSKVVLLSPSIITDYEIHISQWVGFSETEGGEPILPEVRKLSVPVLCLYGEDEKDETICAVEKDGAKQENLKSVELPGDHHFNGEYDEVAKLFLGFMAGN